MEYRKCLVIFLKEKYLILYFFWNGIIDHQRFFASTEGARRADPRARGARRDRDRAPEQLRRGPAEGDRGLRARRAARAARLVSRFRSSRAPTGRLAAPGGRRRSRTYTRYAPNHRRPQPRRSGPLCARELPTHDTRPASRPGRARTPRRRSRRPGRCARRAPRGRGSSRSRPGRRAARRRPC